MTIRHPHPRAVALAAGPPVAALVTELPVPLVRQWGNEWCWAACAEMVFRFYQHQKTQCELANQLLKKQGCCVRDPAADKPMAVCDKACDLADVATLYGLDGNGLTATLQGAPIRFADVAAEIAARRPVEVKVLRGGRFHVIVVRGAGLDAHGRETVAYNDPWTAREDTDDTFTHFEQVFAGHLWRQIEEL